MGGFLGALAGGGMLVLIGALFIVFLRETGAIKSETARKIRSSAALTLGMGAGYWLFSALVYQVMFGGLDSAARLGSVFRGPYLQRMFQALFSPEWFAPVSGLFAYAAHALGRALFGQYMLSGLALALCATGLSVCLLRSAAERVWNEEMALDLCALVLSAPGAVFFFLPGWAPLALLGGSAALYFAAKRIPPRQTLGAPGLLQWASAACMILSAAVAVGCVYGRLG